MRSPAAFAIASEFKRYRWGLTLVVYLLALFAIKLLILEPGRPLRLFPPNNAGALVVVPLSIVFFYFLAVFSFGFAGDLAARQSIYPSRMFTLPVTTSALAGWPMLYGMAAMIMLWLITALFVQLSSGIVTFWVAPALLAAVFLAWTQVLTWMPYPLPGLRVASTVLWLVGLDVAVIVAVEYQLSESVMVAALLPQLPLAYFAGRFALARARRGELPDWRNIAIRFAQTARRIVPRRRDDFRSPLHAQTWFEWQRYGRSLPAMVAIVLPCELWLLFVFDETPRIVFFTLLVVLLTPAFMASFVATRVSSSTRFIAVRPLTTVVLVAATLRATIWSTVGAWLVVLIVTPLAVTWSNTWSTVIDGANQFIDFVGPPRAIVLALLGCSALLVSTWRQLVRSLYVGLTGREWIVKSSMLIALSFLVASGPVIYWLNGNRDLRIALWEAIPWIAGVLAAIKVMVAIWAVIRLSRRGLLTDRALLIGASCWTVVVFALYGVLAWVMATPHFPRYFLALLAILSVPLARLSVAPLALAVSRHR